MSDTLEPPLWWEVRFNRLEINPNHEGDIIVNVGANQPIIIDKLYGPLAAYPVRVRLEYTDDVADWVVEYQNPKTKQWEEKARWHCQENWPENE